MDRDTVLYPLKFKTIFKDKIWGGSKIRDFLQKDFSPLPNCGETWEISGVEGNISVVKEGPLEGKDLKSLLGEYQHHLVGQHVYEEFKDEFPLLIKFIDANADLSIQVHPDDLLAKKRHQSKGKTEMWYVLQADENSTLISGFNQELDKDTFKKYFDTGQLKDVLNQEKVQQDDVYFLPAGRIHTIGKGLLIAEIQQTSDITYRIYDFDRVDSQGNKRDLHVEEALEAIDYSYHKEYKASYIPQKNKAIPLVSCQYFTTNKYDLDEPITLHHAILDSFVIYICTDGEGELKIDDTSYSIHLGDSILVPASCSEKIDIVPFKKLKLLESYIA